MADLSCAFGIFLVGKPNEIDVDLQVETSGFGAQINAIFNLRYNFIFAS